MSIIKTFKNKTATSLADKEGYVVEFDTDGINVANAITDKIVGVITRAGATECDVCVHGECQAKAGGTVTAGKHVIPHTDGTIKDTTSTSNEFGLALESGVAGNWVKIIVLGSNGAVA